MVTQEWKILGGVQGGNRKKNPVSLMGDSGALLMNDDMNVVAMVIGGI